MRSGAKAPRRSLKRAAIAAVVVDESLVPSSDAVHAPHSPVTSRAAHRIALFNDRDILHVATVAAAACVLSAGVVYLGYFVHVLRVARNAPCRPERGECVL